MDFQNNDMNNQVNNAFDQVSEKAENTFNQAQENANNAFNQATENANSAFNQATENANNAFNQAADQTNNFFGYQQPQQPQNPFNAPQQPQQQYNPAFNAPQQPQQPQQQFNAQDTFQNAFNTVKEEVKNTANTVANGFNPNAVPQGNYNAPQYGMPQAPGADNGKTLAIIGLVCGILSIVLSLFISYRLWFLAILALGAGVAGLVCSSMGQKKARAAGEKTGLSTAGLICSIVGLCLTVLLIISCIACYACVACSGYGILNGLSNYY